MSDYEPVQDPIIRSTARSEMLWQAAILSIITSISFWLFGFQFALLALLIVGFALTTLNIMGAAMSTNVHIAEVRKKKKKTKRDIDTT